MISDTVYFLLAAHESTVDSREPVDLAITGRVKHRCEIVSTSGVWLNIVYSSPRGYGKKAAGISAETYSICTDFCEKLQVIYSSLQGYCKKGSGSVKVFPVFKNETL